MTDFEVAVQTYKDAFAMPKPLPPPSAKGKRALEPAQPDDPQKAASVRKELTAASEEKSKIAKELEDMKAQLKAEQDKHASDLKSKEDTHKAKLESAKEAGARVPLHCGLYTRLNCRMLLQEKRRLCKGRTSSWRISTRG